MTPLPLVWYYVYVSTIYIQGPLFFGPACECDRNGCPSVNGELCSARGECTCNGCRCNVEPNTQLLYYGDACECSPDTNCVDPDNSTVSVPLAWLHMYSHVPRSFEVVAIFNPQSSIQHTHLPLLYSKLSLRGGYFCLVLTIADQCGHLPAYT